MLRSIWNYIKDFLDKCIYHYKNDETYRKSTKNILLFFVVVNLICLFINYFNSGWLKDRLRINESWYVIISIVICLARLFVQIMYSFITIPSDFIQPDMDKLPSKIGKYPVIVQYDPPKWLNPSEVWLLYNKSFESTNIDCLLYKWEHEWLIEIDDKWNWTMILNRNKEIDNKVPSYERQYRTMVFGFDRKERVVWKWGQNKLDVREVADLHSELLKYCIEKWWMNSESIKNAGCSRLLPIILYVLLIPVFPVLWFVAFIYFFITVIYYWNKSWKTGFGGFNIWKKISITDEWEKLLAHIVGYKYWLEHCEEKQIKKILKDDPSFNSRTLPYVIALRMDWKLLDKKFYK